ncbi:MAG TPA: molybdate ABC transporter substrate-binding protein [Sporichthyaceae bacterium]|jgi:molybdate transport system substrate-binding protein|nr:molybdate ABC transporter substrate-binding protein [Sporichthyaceae bacterium]
MIVGLVTLLLVGCGPQLRSAIPPTATPTAASASATPTLGGTVTVLAAESLQRAFESLRRAFGAVDPGTDVELSFGHSPAQVVALREGAPGDVPAAAAAEPVAAAQRFDLLAGSATVFARNSLQIVVARGDPKGITSIGDLARPGLTVLLPDPATPAGAAAARVVAASGTQLRPTSYGAGTEQVMTTVRLGEADAGIVFVTDVRAAGDAVTGVAIPDEVNVVLDYPIAVLAAAHSPDAARRFVDFVESAAGRAVLDHLGFRMP